jgi:hypothetical protein
MIVMYAGYLLINDETFGMKDVASLLKMDGILGRRSLKWLSSMRGTVDGSVRYFKTIWTLVDGFRRFSDA